MPLGRVLYVRNWCPLPCPLFQEERKNGKKQAKLTSYVHDKNGFMMTNLTVGLSAQRT